MRRQVLRIGSVHSCMGDAVRREWVSGVTISKTPRLSRRKEPLGKLERYEALLVVWFEKLWIPCNSSSR